MSTFFNAPPVNETLKSHPERPFIHCLGMLKILFFQMYLLLMKAPKYNVPERPFVHYSRTPKNIFFNAPPVNEILITHCS